MDREDARFVVAALTSRIEGDRAELDRLHASSFVRLMASAPRIKKLGAEWPPAHIAALELETIAAYGSKAANAAALPDLQIFVDKLQELIDEPEQPAALGPRNRFERRRAVSGRAAVKARRAHDLERLRQEKAQRRASLAEPLG